MSNLTEQYLESYWQLKMILSALLRFSERIHSIETFIYKASEVSKLFTQFLNGLFALNNGVKDSYDRH